jgi:hypothetical protein
MSLATLVRKKMFCEKTLLEDFANCSFASDATERSDASEGNSIRLSFLIPSPDAKIVDFYDRAKKIAKIFSIVFIKTI